MDYKKKYNKYKTKYIQLKNNDMINQYGGNKELDLWEKKYPDLLNLINEIGRPAELIYLCDPTSIRGKQAHYILEKIYDNMKDKKIYSLKDYYKNIVDEITDYDTDYHNKMYDLMILSLQCILYIVNKSDEEIIFNPGRGDIDPYNTTNIDIPIYNKLLSKYPYIKAMCPLGHECPIWNTKLLYRFKQPFHYFINRNSEDFNDAMIIQASNIITNKEVDYYKELAFSHAQLWDHLIMPKADYLYEMKYGMLSFDENNELHKLYKIKNKKVEAVIPHECLTFDGRISHGTKIHDKWWRANYPFINIFCMNMSGMYYWD